MRVKGLLVVLSLPPIGVRERKAHRWVGLVLCVASPSVCLCSGAMLTTSILRMKSSTLRHVPKGARNAWAHLVGEIFHSVSLDHSDQDAWCKSFMLPRCILANPARGVRSHWRDTEKLVQARIGRWRAGDILGLWSEVVESENRLNHRHGRGREVSSESLLVGNARRALEDGQLERLHSPYPQAVSLLPPQNFFSEMLAKHPQANPPSIPSAPPPTPVQISADGVIKALKSFPNGSAPGPSWLQDLSSCPVCGQPFRILPCCIRRDDIVSTIPCSAVEFYKKQRQLHILYCHVTPTRHVGGLVCQG